MPVTIKLINRSGNANPAYATSGSSGLDIRAFLTELVILQPMERKLIPTGLYVEIPSGYEIQVRSRSGLAIHQGISCLNAPGTIDSDYRGEIQVILINLSSQSQTIVNGDRIAQLVLQKIETLEWKLDTVLQKTDRSGGGFGHSGIK
jgi:dUTP pyrophosphatase